jgi:sugar phosphate isomerase/epimerase
LGCGLVVSVQPALISCSKATVSDNTNDWQIGCWTRPWRDYPYQVAMDNIVAAGMKYVALTTAKSETGRVLTAANTIAYAEQVGEEARKRDLKITHVHAGVTIRPDTATPLLLKNTIDRIDVAGGKSLLLTNLGDEETYERCCKIVADACVYAAKKNISITLKVHGGMLMDGPMLRRAAAKIEQPNLEIMYDTGNIVHYTGGKVNPVDDVATLDGMISSLSAKDYTTTLKGVVTPGDGDIDYPAFVSRLKKGGFKKGPILIEQVGKGDLDHTLAEAKKAKQFLEQLFNA